MTKRLITLLAALLVLGFVVAGCGDDESDSAGNGDTTAAETAPGATADTGTTTGDETVSDDATGTDTVAEDEPETAKGGGAAAPASRAQTRETCEKSINGAQQLSADAKEKLSGLCEKATSKDPDDLREAAREFCETMVEESFPNDAPARDQALEQCERAGQQQQGGN